MNSTTTKFRQWLSDTKALNKAAADAAAFEMKDPTDKGTPDIPKHPDGDNRSKLQLPTNQKNDNEACIKDDHIMSVTKPNGVGQGEYITPESGDAKDKAFTSPTTPLSKIATRLDEALAGLAKQAGTPVEAPAPAAPVEAPAAPVAPEKSASTQQDVDMPTSLLNDPDMMHKLAGIGALLVGTEEGRQAVAEALEKSAGAMEARQLIASVREEMYKEAAAAEAAEQQEIELSPELQKIASAHLAEMNKFEYEFEKQAYAQGAADADAVDASMQGGEGAPSIPGSEGLTDEEVISIMQQMVQSGEMSEEEAAALIQQLSADGDPGGSPEEIAAALQAAVASGQITEEQAMAAIQALTGGAVGGGAEAAAEAAPVEEMAPAEKAASVIATLFGTPHK